MEQTHQNLHLSEKVYLRCEAFMINNIVNDECFLPRSKELVANVTNIDA